MGYRQNQLKMQIASKIQVQLFGHETEDFFGNQMHPEDEILNRLKNQENKFIKDGPRRVQKFFNLVSTRSPMIKEQMAIVLANVVSSGDKEFHLEQLTDHCITTLVKLMRAHKDEEEAKRVTDSATLAAVMTILNFTSTTSKDLTDGLIEKGFMANCESLIEDANVCFEVKTVCLLTVSNIYINHYHERQGNHVEVLPATKNYGLTVIRYWDNILKKGEHPEQVRNLIYSSLVLWFNLTFMRKLGSQTAASLREIEVYVDLLSENIVEAYGDDSLIARMLLQYFTLLITDDETSSFILLNEVLIAYLFRKLLSPKAIEHYSLQGIDDTDFKIDPRLIYLSSEALRSIVERIEEDTCAILRKKLQEMNNFDLVLKCIDDLFQNN